MRSGLRQGVGMTQDVNTLFWHDPAAGVDAAPIPYCSSSEDSGDSPRCILTSWQRTA